MDKYFVTSVGTLLSVALYVLDGAVVGGGVEGVLVVVGEAHPRDSVVMT